MPADRRYIGFDGYAKAMDNLNKGDVVIFTTPCAFRWVHYKKAIDKGLNVFMEKPLCPDGPTAPRMLALNDLAKKKDLKVGVGLMVPPQPAPEANSLTASRTVNSATSTCCALTASTAPLPPVTHSRRRKTRASCSTKSAASTVSSGRVAARSATISSTTSMNAAG